jgi:magnesium transporter
VTGRARQLAELRRLAEAGDAASFQTLAQGVHPSDLSDLLVELEPELRLRLVQALPPELVSDAIAEMEEDEHPEALLAALVPEKAADIVEELEDDDAADLIADLPADAAARILSSVEDRAELERLIEYDEETAGGRMTSELVAVSVESSAAQAIDEIRRQAEEVGDFYQVYCIDADRRLAGVLSLKNLVVARPESRVSELMEPPPAMVPPELDQEEVARLMARYNVPAVPVVDDRGVLLGRVTFDDVIDVVEAEQTEDLLRFGGVPSEESLGGTWADSVRLRLPWLYVNLITASLGGLVVFLFRDTVSRLVALAAWMPIIAGMGGNAGTQSLAVTVRRIALELIPARQGLALVRKELVVGLINGLAVGLVVGFATAMLGLGWRFGAVVLLAMWGNLLVGATVGAAVPLVLRRLGADPAVASSMFVTASTDVCGFFLLLGLAAVLLQPAG